MTDTRDFQLEVRARLGAHARLRVDVDSRTDRTADEYTAESVAEAKAFQRRLFEAWAAEAVIRLMRERARRAVLDGRAPGPEGALTKLACSGFVRQLSSLGLALRGIEGLAWDQEEENADEWAARVCNAPGLAVGGGTDEIVATMVAERALGLPREPKADTRAARA
jgi:hypothetical protein